MSLKKKKENKNLSEFILRPKKKKKSKCES